MKLMRKRPRCGIPKENTPWRAEAMLAPPWLIRVVSVSRTSWTDSMLSPMGLSPSSARWIGTAPGASNTSVKSRLWAR